MSPPIDWISRDTSLALCCTPGSDADSARTSAALSLGWRSIARHARWSTSTSWSAAVLPFGGDCATRPCRRVVHSDIAAARRWSFEEK